MKPISAVLGCTLTLFAGQASAAAMDFFSPPENYLRRLATDTIPGDARPGLNAGALGCPTELAAPYDTTTLHTGIYWYGPGIAQAPGGVGCLARADGGAISGYYDPSKPVMLFIHGWQPVFTLGGLLSGTTQSTRRENFWYSSGGLNVADAWLRAGWNVAIFHWTQLADDSTTLFMPFNSQAKIWTATYSTLPSNQPPNIAMRYVTPDGYSQVNMPAISVSEMLYAAYRAALAQWDYTGTEPVRVMGHSLGAQLALALGERAFDDPTLPARQRPGRIVLADPYWTPKIASLGQNYDYLAPDANPAARSVRIAQQLVRQGVVLEWLRSSSVLEAGGDLNTPLQAVVTRTDVFPDFVLDPSARHDSAPRWYLWTLGFPKKSLSAANSLEQARQLMNEHALYTQFWGRFTPTPADDVFYKPLTPNF